MTTIEGGAEVLPLPEIFNYGHKQYRVIRLVNQMKVLLVHDKTVYNRKVRADGIWPRNEPACGIIIDVGSLSDPPDIPGLTQFTMWEFFGSNKKIGKLPWECCLAKTDRSLFIFNLQMDSLDEILVQFAELLKTAPSAECDASYFLEHMTERCYEWRYLVSRLRAQTANIGHPARSYVDDDIISKDKTEASTIQRQMTEFVNRHYSAHRMCLCLNTNLPLDEMQDMVVKHFSSVPSNMLPGIDFFPFTHENAYQPKFHENVFFIKAPDAIPQITLTWCVPPETPASQCKPYHFLKNMLETERENSLHVYLEKKNWMLSFHALIDTNVVFTLFKITVELTDNGAKHVDDVLEVIFSYIRLNLQELKHSASLEQLYWDSVNHNRSYILCQTFELDDVHRLLDEFMYYTSDTPGKDEFNANAVTNAIDSLNERKFNITFVSENVYDESSEYCKISDRSYNATYAERAFPEKWTVLWNNPGTLAEIFVPLVNPYISTDFSIVYDVNQPRPTYPEKVYETDVSALWFRPGSQCLDVCGGCCFYFQSSISSNSPKNVTMLAVLERILETRAEHKMYRFTQKNFWFERHGAGLTLKLFGPNHKQRLIMDNLTKMLKQFVWNVTEEDFQNAVRDERIDNKMKMYGSPIKYTKKLLRSIVRIGYVAPHEMFHLLKSVQFTDFQLFCQQFFTKMKIHALIQGNVTVDEAKSIMQTVETNLGCNKVDEVVEMRMIGRTLPAGSHHLSINSFNDEQRNTARLTYYQIGPNTLRQNVLLDLLKHIISSSPFGVDETRSLKHEWRSSNLDDDMLGGILTILSKENESRDALMNDFCEKFPKLVISDIRHMSAEMFQERLTYCLEERDGSRDNLETEIERNWLEILSGEYLFDRMQQEREILSTISHSDIVQFVTEVFDSTTRHLSIEIIGYNETSEVSNDELVYAENHSKGSEIRIENIDEFKAILDRQAKK